MVIHRIFTFVVGLSLAVATTAQYNRCGTDIVYQHQLTHDPGYAEAIAQQKIEWSRYQQNLLHSPNGLQREDPDTVYTIPIVFHVIHTGEPIGSPKNPDDATLQELVSFLNEVFSACCSTSSSWIPEYPDINHGGVNVPIQFVLAKRNPACQATSGINRVNGSNVPGYAAYGVTVDNAPGAQETDIKQLSNWSSTYYLNIWIVTDIQSYSQPGPTGFAYIPSGYAIPNDGVVLKYSWLKWAIVHEVGHYLGLYHTFTGSDGWGDCPENDDCITDGDLVCDTDPHFQINGCPTGVNTCTGGSWAPVVYNIMNYSECPDRFTAGQRDRMLFALLHFRPSLLLSNGGLALGEEPVLPPFDTPVEACTPNGMLYAENLLDAGPHHVQLANLNYISQGYTGDDFQYYIDHTAAQSSCLSVIPPKTIYLKADTIYILSVSQGFSNPEHTKVWIDWNGDGEFQTQDIALNHTGFSGQTNQTVSALVIVRDESKICTPLRMRVSSDFFGANPPSSCANPVYGQVEDFAVWVTSSHYSKNSILCEGDAYEFNGILYTEPASLSHTFTTTAGCDSIVSVTLSFAPPPPQPTIERTGNVLSTNASFAHYQWYLDNTPIAGATTQQYTVTETGSYQVEVGVSEDCTGLSDVFEVAALGIDENNLASLHIFPMPSNGRFHLTTTIGSAGRIRVFSAPGKLVYDKVEPSLLRTTLDLTSCTQGVYLLLISSGEQYWTSKLSIE